ncbi:MAG: alpha/beta hydrolase [Phormidesmis sp.]
MADMTFSPPAQLDRSNSQAYLLNDSKTFLDGKPLLFYFPGLDETGRDLIDIEVASLAADFNVRALIVPAKDLDDWDQLAASAIALIKDELSHLPGSLPVYLCAESFGGCLALTALLQAPDLFDLVILVNSASSLSRVVHINIGSRLLPFVPQALYDFSTNFAIAFLAPPQRLSPAGKKGLIASTRDTPKSTLQWRIDLMRDFTLTPADKSKLRQIDRPVLILGSKQDRILPSVEEAQRLAKIFSHSQVVVLPDSGHACLAEKDFDLDAILRERGFITAA